MISTKLQTQPSQAPASKTDDDVLVRVENVGKIFCRDFKKSLYYGTKDSVKDLLSFGNKTQPLTQERELRPGEFWANKDISFELRRGECLGLIGHNGAGKTTLLKMLNGLIKPDTGRIEMRGRVGALIALGAGFNPLLSGRENIYINGSVLGLSKEEIDSKLDEIIDFSEIREFIDAPVQTYSSGMQVRLGFSVATAMEPDVLILDEVLAVGDAAFRAKSLERVSKLLKSCAVIFVSHQAIQVARVCERVLWLDSGKVVQAGETQQLLKEYTKSLTPDGKIKNHKEVKELGVCCTERVVLEYEDPLEFAVHLSVYHELTIGAIIIAFVNESGEVVAQARTATGARCLGRGDYSLLVAHKDIRLTPGCYGIHLNIFEDDMYKHLLVRMPNCMEILINGTSFFGASYAPDMTVSLVLK